MKVTISAGIAMLRPNEGPDTLLARADKVLMPRRHGGDRIAAA